MDGNSFYNLVSEFQPFISTYPNNPNTHCTEIIFFTEDFFSKWDQICRNLLIRSHLLKKSLKGNFIFYAVKRVSVAKRK